ncbi:MAG: hypothetical protein WCI89_00695 [bacterium]
MTSQVVFTLDSKIKAKAMKRAREAGVPFASYLRQASEDFAEGKSGLGIVHEILPKKVRLLEQESRLLDAGKGRRFSSLKAAQSFIDSL